MKTNLDRLTELVKTEPWKIIRRMVTCMECPKLDECVKQENFKNRTEDQCKSLLTKWLYEEANLDA